jgi:Zn-dependent peptidase ImmA (M78 family)
LVKLARALGVRVEFFFRDVDVTITDGAYRRQARLTKPRRSAIEEQIRERVERYLAVEQLFGPAAGATAVAPSHGENIDTPEAAEAAADGLRERWHLGFDPIENVCETLEDHDVKVVCHDVDDRRFSGWSCWVNESVPVVVVNGHHAHTSVCRQRFTLAHELAHIWFQLPDDRRLAEKIANRFAGAFLVPRAAVDLEFGQGPAKLLYAVLEPLKWKWGLSLAAWAYRLTDVGRVSESEAAQFWRCYSAAGYRKDGEPGDGDVQQHPLERTTRLERLLRQAWAAGLLSESRAAELSDDPAAFWRDILPPQRG